MWTKSYGSWHSNVSHAGITLEQGVTDALDNYGFDDAALDAIVDAYRDAINSALPAGVQLCGNEFYGPAYERDCDFPENRRDENGRLDIDAIVAGIDFWHIVETTTEG